MIEAEQRDWAKEYGALSERVKQEIWNQAKSACPHCGVQQVPQSWAVVTATVFTDIIVEQQKKIENLTREIEQLSRTGWKLQQERDYLVAEVKFLGGPDN